MAFRRLCACVCDAAPRGPSAPLHTRSRTQSQTPDDRSDTGQRETHAPRARARGGVADEHAASRKRKTQKKRKHVRYGKPIIDGPEPNTTRLGTGRTVHADTRGDMDVHRAASARPANGGRIRPCVLLWKCTRLRPHADRWSGAAAGPYVRVCVCVSVCCVCRCARVVAPLLPRMKASPYLALSCPFTYSSVCSIAMFMKPSRHASTPVRRLASSACAKRSRARRHATSVVHARVELDHHRPSKHLLEELRRVVLRGGRGARHRCWSWSVGGGHF